MALYKDFTEGVLYLIKRKIKKGVQILTDLLEILVNKNKEKKRDKKKQDKEKKEDAEKDDKKDGKKKGKDVDKSETIAPIDETLSLEQQLKKAQADKQHADYLIHQSLLFRAYGYVAIEKYELA